MFSIFKMYLAGLDAESGPDRPILRVQGHCLPKTHTVGAEFLVASEYTRGGNHATRVQHVNLLPMSTIIGINSMARVTAS